MVALLSFHPFSARYVAFVGDVRLTDNVLYSAACDAIRGKDGGTVRETGTPGHRTVAYWTGKRIQRVRK